MSDYQIRHVIAIAKNKMNTLAMMGCIALSVPSFAQGLGINTTGAEADTSAMLDVSSTTKGLLIPRMTNSQMNAISMPAKGLTIYRTDLGEFWVNTGTMASPNWNSFNTNKWAIDGNAGTNPPTHFIGTTDNQPLVFRSLNIYGGAIDPSTRNVFFGPRSSSQLSSGSGNVAVGHRTLFSALNMSNHVAIGDSALYHMTNLAIYTNIAVGALAGSSNTSGRSNLFIGAGAGYLNTTGDENVALGAGALYRNLTNYDNVAIGRLALRFAQTATNQNVVIGYLALYNTTAGLQNVVIGSRAGFFANANSYSVFIGDQAGLNATNGVFNIGLGNGSLKSLSGGDYCIGIGHSAMRDMTTGHHNIAIGDDALGISDVGSQNIALGYVSGWHNGAGNFNIAIGHKAFDGYYSDTPDHNVAIGDSCLWDISGGDGDNTAIGSIAGYSTTEGDHNTFLGSQAASLNTTGSLNVAVGHQSMRETISNIGITTFGYQAGDANSIGNYSTLIGAYTDVDADGYVSSTALGYNTAITASDQIRAGWLFTSSIGGFQNWSNISDGRYKSHITQNVPGMEFIKLLQPVTYELNTESLINRLALDDIESSIPENLPLRRSGFIAQDVVAAAQRIGYDFSGIDAPKNTSDMYGLRYEEFVVPLVKAVQEQQGEILQLKEQSEEIRRRLRTLENQ